MHVNFDSQEKELEVQKLVQKKLNDQQTNKILHTLAAQKEKAQLRSLPLLDQYTTQEELKQAHWLEQLDPLRAHKSTLRAVMQPTQRAAEVTVAKTKTAPIKSANVFDVLLQD